MENKNKLLLTSNIIASIYSLIFFVMIFQLMDTSPFDEELIVIPAMIFAVFTIGVVLAWIGFFKDNVTFNLIANFMYFGGALAFFGIIPLLAIIFGFIGYSQQKKLNKKN